MKAHNFVALGPTGSKTTFFERSDLCLLGNRKKIGFAGLLRVLLIGQITIKSYHKKQINPDRLAQTVSIVVLILFDDLCKNVPFVIGS